MARKPATTIQQNETNPIPATTSASAPSQGSPILISLPHSALFQAVKRIYPLCSTSSLIPVLANIRLAFSVPSLMIKATDLATTIETSIPYHGPAALTLLLDARKLNAILKAISSYALPIEIAYPIGLPSAPSAPPDPSEPVTLSCGSASYALASADPEDFPISPTPPPDSLPTVLPGKLLSDLLAAASFAASREDSRAALCSVRLSLSPSGIEAVSTDGFRAVIACVAAGNLPADIPGPLIIPRESAALLADLIDPKGQVDITPFMSPSGSPQVCFTVWDASGASTRVHTRLLDLTYPDVHASVPSYDYHITSPVESFLNAVYRACAAGSRKEPVTIHISRPSDNGRLSVTLSQETEGCSSRILHSPLACNLPPGPVNTVICVNAAFLIQHLEHSGADHIRLEFPPDAYGAITWQSTSGDAANPVTSRHIIMPIRL